MRWRKLGIVYAPRGSSPLARSHAMTPTPVLLESGLIRVFVSMCDGNGVSRPFHVDLDARNPLRVLAALQEPLLDTGEPGSFDDNGALVTSVVMIDDRHWFMYYVGFELGTKIRYRLLTGLAISEDSGHTFRRVSRAPVLERSDSELHFRCAAHVMRHNGRFRMWYSAGSEWVTVGEKLLPHYDLRYMESEDGVHWPEAGEICMRAVNADEHGLGRPWVMRDDSGYSMVYSVRRRSLGAYRLGYARSDNGLAWQRRDEALGLGVSSSGWDSQSIMYAAILRVGEQTYAFYNGNEFGRDGFGVAVLEEA
jgi:hypothetical protein